MTVDDGLHCYYFCLLTLRHTGFTLFPYTTLFRSMGINFVNDSGSVEVLSGTVNFSGVTFGGTFAAASGTMGRANVGATVTGIFRMAAGARNRLTEGAFSYSPSVGCGGAGVNRITG